MTTTTVVRPSYLAAGLGVLAIAMVLAIRTPWSADASTARASNVAVDCEPAQRALVRQIVTSGDPQITVQCVSGPAAQTVAYVDASGRVVQPVPLAAAPITVAPPAAVPIAATPAVVPAVYNTPVVTEREVIREVEVGRPAPVTRTSTSSTAPAGEPKRDWKKTALVIGGSAGAGAGIGAIVGGKKGAAIGAAIGGGAGTLYEVLKKK